jgi:hypothetical protein
VYREAERLISETLIRVRGKHDLQFVGHLAKQETLSDRDLHVILLSLFSDGLSTVSNKSPPPN